MLWILLVIPAAYFIFKELWFGEFLRPDGFIDWLCATLFGAITAAFVFVLCLGCAALTGLAFPSHPVVSEKTALVSLRDKDGVSGHFFLGSGFIDSNQYYFFYKTMPDGGFVPGKIKADAGVRVYETDRKDAEVITYRWEVDSTFARLVAIPTNAGGYTFDFLVPKGTIRTGYSM